MEKLLKPMLDAMSKHVKGKPLTEGGAEVPNPIPQDPPVGYKKQESMFEVMRRMIKEEKLKAALEAEGLETPEEADDFDVDDDVDPTSPYEHNFDPVANPADLEQLRNAARDATSQPANPAGNPPTNSPSNPPANPGMGGGRRTGLTDRPGRSPPAPGTLTLSVHILVMYCAR